jgi:hypothetical protein
VVEAVALALGGRLGEAAVRLAGLADDPDVALPAAAAAPIALVAVHALAGRPVGGDLDDLAEVVELAEVPWLSALARAAAGLGGGDGWSRAAEVAAERDLQGDPWGSAAARLFAVLGSLVNGGRPVDDLVVLSDRLRDLDAGTVEAWCRAWLATALARAGEDRALEVASTAEAAAAGDLRRVPAVGHQLEHPHLAVGQAAEGEAPGRQHLALQPPDLLEQPAQQVGRHGSVAGGGRPDGGHEPLGHSVGPAKQPARAGLGHGQHGGVVEPAGDHQHPVDAAPGQGPDRPGGPVVDLVDHDDRHRHGAVRHARFAAAVVEPDLDARLAPQLGFDPRAGHGIVGVDQDRDARGHAATVTAVPSRALDARSTGAGTGTPEGANGPRSPILPAPRTR